MALSLPFPDLRSGSECEKIGERSLSIMSSLIEIQKAIEELAPEEREELRNWLDGYDSAVEPEWVRSLKNEDAKSSLEK